jgi:hypothetical protein
MNAFEHSLFIGIQGANIYGHQLLSLPLYNYIRVLESHYSIMVVHFMSSHANMHFLNALNQCATHEHYCSQSF